MKQILALTALIASLAACGGTTNPPPMTDDPGSGGGSGDPTGGGGGGGPAPPALTVASDTVVRNGVIDTGLRTARISVEGGATPDGSTGYQMIAGVLEDNSGIIARSSTETGVLGFNFTPFPASGTATINAVYGVATVANPRRETIPIFGEVVEAQTSLISSQPITLTSNFGAATGTLTGSAGGLTINGTFNTATTSLTGSVTYNGVAGTLSGNVGAAEALGAFHGANATSAYAGGFVNN